jgi:predicted Fe-Mo cluster-binding NifX family protein
MTKIAISCEGPSLELAVDPRFGRAAGFMIVDPSDMSFEYLDNGSSQTMAQGAGIQAAETVVRSGAKVVLTGYVGPKAFHALQTAGIQIGQNLEDMQVGEAVQAFLDGRVNAAQAPNSGGHGR